MIGELLACGFVNFGGARCCAVYALLARGEVIYVGQSKNVYCRIAQHVVRRDGPKYSAPRVTGAVKSVKYDFDQVFVRFCAKEELDKLELELIDKFNPKYNVIGRRQVEGIPRVNIRELTEKLGFQWNQQLPSSSPSTRRRRVA